VHFLTFLSKVEGILRNVVRRCYPTSWDENHITYSITDDLARELRSVDVDGLNRPFKTKWAARKLRGHVEHNFGDLAVIVRLKSWSGEEVNGVGLIEAKRRDRKKGTFGAIRRRQIEKVQRHAPSSRVLLYDYDKITEFTDNLALTYVSDMPHPSLPLIYWAEHSDFRPYSYCVAAPTSMVLATGLSTARHDYVANYHAAIAGTSAMTLATDVVDQWNGCAC
jgi:hypothetical protein